MAAWIRANRGRLLAWAGLVLGWAAISLSPRLAPPWREAAFFAGWVAFFAAWLRVSPCAGGRCALPPSAERKERP